MTSKTWFMRKKLINCISFKLQICALWKTLLREWKIMGWPKSPLNLFCKIKGIFFIFTNNFIDLDILSILAISHCWLLEAKGAANHLPMHKSPTAKKLFGQHVNSIKKLHKLLLTYLISHCTSIYCTNNFLHFSCFYLLK